MNPILDKISAKTGLDLPKILSEDLTGTELNSLLLAVFDRKTGDMSPADLLRSYAINRFVQPAEGDPLALRGKELACLQLWKEYGFDPLDLSPVSLLGTCSVPGTVDQKKILSATRGTEVLADATNAIALHIAYLRKTGTNVSDILKFCTTHRHVRTPPPLVKGFTAHFKIACMVSAGRDSGNFEFECSALTDHVIALKTVLATVFDQQLKYIKIQPRHGYTHGERLVEAVSMQLASAAAVIVEPSPVKNDYYQGIQFKAVIEADGREIEIADGGFTDWTQQFLQNKKERLLISGLGIEYLGKL